MKMLAATARLGTLALTAALGSIAFAQAYADGVAAQATAAYEAAFAPVLERGPNDGASAVRSMIAYMHGRTV